MFRVTQEWIEKFNSKDGAWTLDQLEQIGVSWPPLKGWKQRVEGMLISEERRARFEMQLDIKARRQFRRQETSSGSSN